MLTLPILKNWCNYHFGYFLLWCLWSYWGLTHTHTRKHTQTHTHQQYRPAEDKPWLKYAKYFDNTEDVTADRCGRRSIHCYRWSAGHIFTTNKNELKTCIHLEIILLWRVGPQAEAQKLLTLVGTRSVPLLRRSAFCVGYKPSSTDRSVTASSEGAF